MFNPLFKCSHLKFIINGTEILGDLTRMSKVMTVIQDWKIYNRNSTISFNTTPALPSPPLHLSPSFCLPVSLSTVPPYRSHKDGNMACFTSQLTAYCTATSSQLHRFIKILNKHWNIKQSKRQSQTTNITTDKLHPPLQTIQLYIIW